MNQEQALQETRETDQVLRSIYSPKKISFLKQPPENLSIGGRVRRERILRNLSLEDMSGFLGISPSYLGALERGKRPISRKIMKRLHERLNISYDFLLEGRPVTGSMIAQYVRESTGYSPHHNIDVLLNVASRDELEGCYQLIHTYLTHARSNSEESDPTPTVKV